MIILGVHTVTAEDVLKGMEGEVEVWEGEGEGGWSTPGHIINIV